MPTQPDWCRVHRRVLAVALAALAASMALSGCFGNGRSEWAYDAVQLDATTDDGLTGEGVVVAVLDTGITIGHPAFRHLRDGEQENGELIAFRDFYTGKEGVEHAHDPDGHGTHVTSIIAARSGGTSDRLFYNADLRGGTPDVRLVVARVCTAESCKAEAIADAVSWSVRQGAQVISLSLGGRGGPVISELVRDEVRQAVERAIDRGVVVVASAGNEGPDNDDVHTPADIPRVIAVGAVDDQLKVWKGSSRGDNSSPCRGGMFPEGRSLGRCDPNRKPELVAPGVDVLGAWTGDGYARSTGTSQATPFVTSAVVAMLQDKARLTSRGDVVEVKEVLMETARPVAGQRTPHDPAAGYGLVQAKAAADAYR